MRSNFSPSLIAIGHNPAAVNANAYEMHGFLQLLPDDHGIDQASFQFLDIRIILNML